MSDQYDRASVPTDEELDAMRRPPAELCFGAQLHWLVFTTYRNENMACLDAAFLMFSDAEDYAAEIILAGPEELAVTLVQSYPTGALVLGGQS